MISKLCAGFRKLHPWTSFEKNMYGLWSFMKKDLLHWIDHIVTMLYLLEFLSGVSFSTASYSNFFKDDKFRINNEVAVLLFF